MRCTRDRKEASFVVKYPEHNGRSEGADPWSIQQTGVYQSFDTATKDLGLDSTQSEPEGSGGRSIETFRRNANIKF